ncbi:MAG TPA: dockerin type I domain-containing protein [Fimbriimonadaceae bacterium]|nr:dockerin type I domain-containing protein [Fimbriimonadaceae bacterium]HRJ97321.1 dockerin type I domain-containing protein [Fimbriimonadaceae bacterium]
MVALNFRSLSSIVALTLAGSALGVVLPLNPGPANNGGSPNWAVFFDAAAVGAGVNITHMTTANTAGAGGAFSVDVYTRVGSALGGPVGSGPGSSPAGWNLIGSAPATQGGTASGVSLLIDIPDISVPAGQVVGVAVVFRTAGPRYFGTGTPAYSVYNDGALQITTGDSRSVPFTTTGSFFTSRALVGEVHYTSAAPATVSGNVDLQDWLASLAGQVVRFEITASGGGPVLQGENVALDGAGNYSFDTALPAGNYDLYAKGSHWLRKVRAIVLSPGAGGASFSLFNGDVDGDNEIAIGDYSLLSNAFGSDPNSPNWDPMADLNGDDEVTIGDYAILSNNFGMIGD